MMQVSPCAIVAKAAQALGPDVFAVPTNAARTDKIASFDNNGGVKQYDGAITILTVGIDAHVAAIAVGRFARMR